MDIRELEAVVRMATQQGQGKTVIESLALRGQSMPEMPDEVARAVESLAGHAAETVRKGLDDISARW